MGNEDTDWNKRYEELDTPWDKGEAAPAIAPLVRDGYFPDEAVVFVPGCGTGHDVAALAGLGFQAVGLDISELAIAQAEEAYSGSNVSFKLGDLFDMDHFQDGSFDVVWEHTCYCAIHPSRRGGYMDSVHRLLKPGGLLIGLFFTDTQMPEGEGPPYETSRDDVVAMFSPSFELVAEGVPPACYDNRVGREWLMVWRRLS